MATLFHDRISGRRGWLPGGFGTRSATGVLDVSGGARKEVQPPGRHNFLLMDEEATT